MSIIGTKWALKTRGIEPQAKAVLFALGDCHNKHTNLCCPDQVMVAQEVCMAVRTVGVYLGLLEEQGFISRRKMSKGHGIITHYTLHFSQIYPAGEETNRKSGPVGNEAKPSSRPFPKAQMADRRRKPNTSTAAESPIGTPLPKAKGGTNRQRSAGPIGNGLPIHIEEPELTRTTVSQSSDEDFETDTSKAASLASDIRAAFETAWSSWPAAGRKRSKSKTQCLEAMTRACRKHSHAQITEAVRKFVRETPEKYVPAFDKWLRDGKFEHYAASENVRQLELPVESVNWRVALARWFADGTWPRGIGEPPDQPDYRGPLEAAEALLPEFAEGHPTALAMRRVIDQRRRA